MMFIIITINRMISRKEEPDRPPMRAKFRLLEVTGSPDLLYQ